MSSALVSRYYDTGTTTSLFPSTITEECGHYMVPPAERRGSFGSVLSFPPRLIRRGSAGPTGPPSVKSASSKDSDPYDYGKPVKNVDSVGPAISFARFSRRGSSGPASVSSDSYEYEKTARRGSIGPLISFPPRFSRRGSSGPPSPAITEDSDTYEQPTVSRSRRGSFGGIPFPPRLHRRGSAAEGPPSLKSVSSRDSSDSYEYEKPPTRRGSIGLHARLSRRGSTGPPAPPFPKEDNDPPLIISRRGSTTPASALSNDSVPYGYEKPAARRSSVGFASRFTRRGSAVPAPPPTENVPPLISSRKGSTAASVKSASSKELDPREFEEPATRRGSVGFTSRFSRRGSTGPGAAPGAQDSDPPRLMNRRGSAVPSAKSVSSKDSDPYEYEKPATRRGSVGFASRFSRRGSTGPGPAPGTQDGDLSDPYEYEKTATRRGSVGFTSRFSRRGSTGPGPAPGTQDSYPSRLMDRRGSAVPSAKSVSSKDSDPYEYEKPVTRRSSVGFTSRLTRRGSTGPAPAPRTQESDPPPLVHSVSSKDSHPYEYEKPVTRRSSVGFASRITRGGSTALASRPFPQDSDPSRVSRGGNADQASISSKDMDLYEYEKPVVRKADGPTMLRRGSTGGSSLPFAKDRTPQLTRRGSVGPSVSVERDPHPLTRRGSLGPALTFSRRGSIGGGSQRPPLTRRGSVGPTASIDSRQKDLYTRQSNRRGSMEAGVSFAGNADDSFALPSSRRGSTSGARIPGALKNIFFDSSQARDSSAFRSFGLHHHARQEFLRKRNRGLQGRQNVTVLDYRPLLNLIPLPKPALYPSRRSPQVFLDVMLRTLGYSKECFKTLETSYYNKPTPLQTSSYNSRLLEIKDESELRELMSCGISTNPCNEHGESLLHQACRNGNITAVKVMLECGASVQVSDDTGRTVLHSAMSAAEPCFEIVDMILQRDLHLLQLCDEQGPPLSYVALDLWGTWIDYLYARRHVYYPSRRAMRLVFRVGVAPSSPKMREEPNSCPLPDPPNALTPELARMVASGKLTPIEARCLLSGEEFEDDEDDDEDAFVDKGLNIDQTNMIAPLLAQSAWGEDSVFLSKKVMYDEVYDAADEEDETEEEIIFGQEDGKGVNEQKDGRGVNKNVYDQKDGEDDEDGEDDAEIVFVLEGGEGVK